MSETINIPDGWVETTLGEVVERITKGTTPKVFSSNSDDINYIKSDALNYGGFLDSERFAKITSKVNEELKRSQLKLDDILLSMAGEYLGKTGLVKKEHLPANTNQAVAIITVNKEIINHIFLWYKLRDTNTVKYFKSIPSQSAQPNINFQEIRTLSINLPTLSEQKSIAKILTSFDDKIELLQAQNKTLEEMAQTIFTEWFGKYQVEDELPDGWKKKTLKDVCLKITDGTHSTVIDNPLGSYYLLSCKNIKGGQVIFNSNDRKIDKNTLLQLRKRTQLRINDLLVTTVGTIGEVAMIRDENIPYELQRSVAIIRPNLEKILPEFLYQFSRSIFFQHQALSRSEGSVQTCLFLGAINGIEIVIPEFSVMHKFEKIISDFYSKIYINNQQIQTLTQTRDALLPKLMSGEIRVKESEL